MHLKYLAVTLLAVLITSCGGAQVISQETRPGTENSPLNVSAAYKWWNILHYAIVGHLSRCCLEEKYSYVTSPRSSLG